MGRKVKLGELQLAIMQELWERGEASVAEVHSSLHDDRGLALTTIATMLTKMENKGLVAHRAEGRRYLYRAAVTAEKVTRSMVTDLTDRLFDGQPAALATYLLRHHELGDEELAQLKALIAAAESGEGA